MSTRSHRDPFALSPLAGLVVVIGLLAAVLALAPAANAATGTVFKVGSDAVVAQGQSVDSVVAVGGDVTVDGTVSKAIIAVGGNVHLGQTARVGTDVKAGDTSIWLVGGELTKASGASVQGDTSKVAGNWAGDVWRSGPGSSSFWSFSGFSLFSWVGSTILALIGALLIAALLPHQVTAVAGRVRERFWPSLGWGALGAIVVVPVVTVLLIVSVIGLLAILPWLFVVVAGLVIGAIGVAALIGEWLLPRLNYRGSSLVLAAVVGVLVLRLVALIPIVGGIVQAIAWMVGLGAAVLALWTWQQHRRQRQHEREAGQERREAA